MAHLHNLTILSDLRIFFSENDKNRAINAIMRVMEYTMKKTDKAIEMVKYAIKRGIRFDYLLVDSWFTCADFVRLITSRHIKCHLLGMIKLGKTKYHTLTLYISLVYYGGILFGYYLQSSSSTRKIRFSFFSFSIILSLVHSTF